MSQPSSPDVAERLESLIASAAELLSAGRPIEDRNQEAEKVPDAENPETINHLNWYMATGFTRPYPGERKVLPPTAFNKPAPTKADDDN